MIIGYLHQEISYYNELNDFECVKSLEEELERQEKRNIFNELKKVEEIADELSKYEFIAKPVIIFLNEKLKIYNYLSEEDKKRLLNTFCEKVFSGDNLLTQSVKEYAELEEIKKYLEKESIDFELNEFKNADIELLGLYNIKKIFRDRKNSHGVRECKYKGK